MTQHDIGDVVRISGLFTQAQVPLDPGTVQLLVNKPDLTTTTLNYPADVQKLSTGSYYYDWPAVTAGVYHYRWVSTGTGAAAEPGTFEVRANAF